MASEFDLIARYFTRAPRTALLGVGDDCALVKQPDGLALAITTDMLVEGVHFVPGADPRALGHKTLAVNLSDLAAMGAEPRWATLAIALPRAEEPWVAAFASGLFALAERQGVELIGGDTTRGPLTMSMTLIGLSPPGLALRRDGAQATDDLWLSGCTGEAALAVMRRRDEIEQSAELARQCDLRLDLPQPRVALGIALRGLASSAIDVSDGLLQDLGHLCDRSQVAAQIEDAAMPRADAVVAAGAAGEQELYSGGDDYEVLFTAPSGARARLAALATRLNITLTRIGTITEGQGVQVLAADGRRRDFTKFGFDHFAHA